MNTGHNIILYHIRNKIKRGQGDPGLYSKPSNEVKLELQSKIFVPPFLCQAVDTLAALLTKQTKTSHDIQHLHDLLQRTQNQFRLRNVTFDALWFTRIPRN